MKTACLLALGAFLTVGAATSPAGTFPDIGYTPPAGWTGPTFRLSQDYPATLPAVETLPWAAIDFRTAPEKYLNSVLDYCFAGNIDVDFAGQDNTIRKWYHAPWLHSGANGREFVHGLTHERTSRTFELAAGQLTTQRNVAVGLYNPRGGFTIGQVWSKPDAPNPAAASFPEGAVTFKLLFTTASSPSVPYLDGAPEWVADLDRSPNPSVIAQTKVRLLQVDVAVRDNRSLCSGWIFGTFHYDKDVQATSPWKKLRPLTLLWGNDPILTPTLAAMGREPAESWVNASSPIVQYRRNPPAGATPPSVLGWAGRGNGPVDNPISSCLSCHSTAQTPAKSNLIPPASANETARLRWFRNLARDESFDTGTQALDFSLQLGVGIQNLREFQDSVPNHGGIMATAAPRYLSPSRAAADYGAAPPKEYRVSRDPGE